MTIYERIKCLRQKQGLSQQDLADKLGYKSRSTINKIELGLRDISQKKVIAFANALNVTPAYLLGWEPDELDKKILELYPDWFPYEDNYLPLNQNTNKLKFPETTENTVTFPVIGEIAAGYEHFAMEDWSGETVEIPTYYLRGRKQDDYFVLSVKGDSMYPLYMDGDKVLILKQTTLNHSGEIGAVMYEDYATLKKVEYVNGEDWLKMIPINPQYPPKRIEGADLEQCRVLGIPKLLIREIDD